MTNETIGSRDPNDMRAITTYIQNTLSELIGYAAIENLISTFASQAIDIWALEAIAEAHTWAQAMAFTPVQRAELCSFLWNEHEKWEFEDIEFGFTSLVHRIGDVETVFEKYVTLLNMRLLPK